MFLVAIDAGHGGHDPGATYRGLKESDITLSYALDVSRMLDGVYTDYDTTLIRCSDVYVPLTERAEFANVERADIFVSVHVNSCENENAASGFEIFHCTGSEQGKYLAECIYNEWAGKKRGVKPAKFTVLTKTRMPAVLLELGFINHYQDRPNLLDIFWKDKAVDAICHGIKRYHDSV